MIIKISKHTSEWERAVHWVARAASRDRKIHPWLCGVLFVERPANMVQAVATDGRRLHSATFHRAALADTGISPDPLHSHDLARFSERTLELGWLTGGTYPAWERVVPRHPTALSVKLGAAPQHATALILAALAAAGEEVPGVDSRYVEDAARCDAELTRVEYAAGATARRPLVLRAVGDIYERWAVIMPFDKEKIK